MAQRYIQYGRMYGVGTLLQAGMDSFEAREYLNARIVFEVLLYLDQQSVEAIFYLGRTAYEMGNIAKAKEYFRQAHQKSPAYQGSIPDSPVKQVSSTTTETLSTTVTQSSERVSEPGNQGDSSGTQWFSVTGKPLKRADDLIPMGTPALVKLLDPGLKLLTADGWPVPPSAYQSTEPVYELTSGRHYQLRCSNVRQNSVPIYLGALGAVLAVLILAN